MSHITSGTLTAVIEWVNQHYFFFQDLNYIEREVDLSVMRYWDSNWIERRETILNISALELYNAAHFLDIPKFIEILSFYIAKKYYKFDALYIFDVFFKREVSISFETAEKIFFDILNYRSKSNCKFLTHQNFLHFENFNTIDGFYIENYNISEFFISKSVKLKSFELFDNIEHFEVVNITKNSHLISNICKQYEYISFNLDIEKLLGLIKFWFKNEELPLLLVSLVNDAFYDRFSKLMFVWEKRVSFLITIDDIIFYSF